MSLPPSLWLACSLCSSLTSAAKCGAAGCVAHMRSAWRPLQATSEGVCHCYGSHVAGGSISKGPWLPRRRLVYGAHFYDGFYVQPLWQLLGEGVTCALMTGFLDSRVAVLLSEVTQTLS